MFLIQFCCLSSLYRVLGLQGLFIYWLQVYSALMTLLLSLLRSPKGIPPSLTAPPAQQLFLSWNRSSPWCVLHLVPLTSPLGCELLQASPIGRNFLLFFFCSSQHLSPAEDTLWAPRCLKLRVLLYLQPSGLGASESCR